MWDVMQSIKVQEALFLLELRHFKSIVIVLRVAERCTVDAGIYPFTRLLLFVTPIFALLYPHLEQYQMYGHINMQAWARL